MATDRTRDRRRDRRRAAELLESAIDERAGLQVSKLVTPLDSDDPDRRAAATWALAEAAGEWPHRTSTATEKLVGLLDDEDEWVRRGSSWALSKIAESAPREARRALNSLTESLDDDDPLVRENTTQAVAEVAEQYPSKARSAVPELARRTEDDDPLVRRYAVRALRKILGEGGFDVSTLDPATVHRLAGDEELVQKDIDVFDAIKEKSAVEKIVDDEPEPGPTTGGPATPARSTEMDDPRPPDEIPDAPIVEVTRKNVELVGGIGTGRTAVVHRARVSTEEDDHVVVALKRLETEEFVDDVDAFATSFERATQTWRRLSDHDHVVSLFGADSTPEPWIAMEYMDAGSLRHRIGRISFEQAVWTAICVVRAVNHAHAQGVVHGGIRPSNVLFSETLEGTWDVPKLTDWGLSRGFFEHATTRKWLVPTYAAPEQLAPDEFGRPDHATDVYQLGTLTYELFAGQPPFVGESTEVAQKMTTEDPRPLTEVDGDLPDELDRILIRALSKRKPERYETVDDFRRALELFARDYAPEVLE